MDNESATSPDRQARRRTVRSFVRRGGRLTGSQQRALDELMPHFGVADTGAMMDLDTVFGRSGPRVLEIGYGDGDTLVAMAALHPSRDFIGIEVHPPGVGHCLLQAKQAGVRNLRLIADDALDVLANRIGEAALMRINLYFPDPWPKKRHHKRRIVQASFVELCASRLIAGGSLHIATDWADYAEHIDAVFALTDRFVCAERRLHAGCDPLDRPTTRFERRGLRIGHRIVDWQFIRV